MLRVDCPRCRTRLEVKTENRRETIACSECGQEFIGIAEEVIREPDRVRIRQTPAADVCGMLSMIASGLAIFLFCVPILGLLLAITGLVLAGVGLKSRFRGLAVASMLLSTVGVIYSIGVMLVLGTSVAVSIKDFNNHKLGGSPQPRIRIK